MCEKLKEKYNGDFFSQTWLPVEEICNLVDEFMENDKGKEEIHRDGKYKTREEQRTDNILYMISGFQSYFEKNELGLNWLTFDNKRKPLTFVELKDLYYKKTYKLTNKDFFSNDNYEGMIGGNKQKYKRERFLFSTYYGAVEHALSDDLYYKYKGCYTMEELERVVPYLDSHYYDRNRIILRYMERMQSLKDRGEEWREKIKKLKAVYDKETKTEFLIEKLRQKYTEDFFRQPWLPLEEIGKLVDDFISISSKEENHNNETQRNALIWTMIYGFEDLFCKELGLQYPSFDTSKKILTPKELKDLFKEKTIKLTRKDYLLLNTSDFFSSSARVPSKNEKNEPCYVKPNSLINIYYRAVENSITSDLYKHKKCYTIDELEKVVPRLYVPSTYYDRDRIILSYMEKMQSLEDRGEEWKEKIKQLQS